MFWPEWIFGSKLRDIWLYQCQEIEENEEKRSNSSFNSSYNQQNNMIFSTPSRSTFLSHLAKEGSSSNSNNRNRNSKIQDSSSSRRCCCMLCLDHSTKFPCEVEVFENENQLKR